MLSIAIDRVRTRYRLPASVRREQPRVQRIVDDALARALEGAIERRGIGPNGYVCVRDVHAVARLRLREPDSALANGVGDAIAAAIEQLIGDGSPSVVQYGSRAHALVDLALSATAGDFSRSWAWAQVGIWRADFPMRADVTAERIVRALASEPTHAAPVVAYVARVRPDRCGELVARATPRAWSALAQAAVAAAGGVMRRRPADAVASPDSNREEPRRSAAATASVARRVVAQSAIARVASTRFADAPADVRQALAALALLETEPSAVRREDGASIVAVIDAAIGSPARADTTRRVREQEPHTRSTVGREPAERSRRSAADAARDGDMASARRGDEAAPQPAREMSRDSAAGLAHGDTPQPHDESAETVPETRQVLRTRHGGLLYLVNLLPRMGLIDTLRDDERWSARGLRWVLHQLAMALASIEPDDPAALVFAGLVPGGPLPSAEQDAPTGEERVALEALCAAMTQALREVLRDRSDAGVESDARLTSAVCRRPARIGAEPGWIEAHFSIDDVSLDIRRAGLDRDPGWLPWLGIVLRFVYA